MHIERLFEIIYILLERKTVTASELAERLEISTRTVYRDIEKLSLAGMPVYMSKGKGGGISILPDFVLDKALLQETDKQDIASALNVLRSLSPEQEKPEHTKIKSLLGSGGKDWIEVDFSSWSQPKEKEKFQLIKHAIFQGTAICFQYANGKGEQSIRTIEPLKLGFKSQAWYLFGYCKTRKENRFFKLSRIRDLALTGDTFQKEIPKQIFFKENSFREEYVTLVMKLAPNVSYRAYEEFEHVQENSDGTLTVSCTYPKGIWLFGYIASFGTECEVLEPEQVRRDYKQDLENIIKKYS